MGLRDLEDDEEGRENRGMNTRIAILRHQGDGGQPFSAPLQKVSKIGDQRNRFSYDDLTHFTNSLPVVVFLQQSAKVTTAVAPWLLSTRALEQHENNLYSLQTSNPTL